MKHKWLTEKEVEQYADAGRFDRFVADWLAMRKLLRRAYMQLDLPISDEVGADLADEILEAWSAMEG